MANGYIPGVSSGSFYQGDPQIQDVATSGFGSDCWGKCYAYWSNGQMCPDPCAGGNQTSPDPLKRLGIPAIPSLDLPKLPTATTIVLIVAALVFVNAFGRGLAARI